MHKVHKSELNSQNGGCVKVRENTKLLKDQGISKISGIVDWDLKEQDDLTNAIFVHGRQNRYSLENYLLEPIYISKTLIDSGVIKPEDINDELTLGRFNKLTEPNEEYQQFCNQYFEFLNSKLRDEDRFDLNQQKQVIYCNEYKMQLPNKYLEMQGHKLESIIIDALIPDKNKLNRFPDKSVVKKIITGTIEALPYFISQNTFTVFQKILDAH